MKKQRKNETLSQWWINFQNNLSSENNNCWLLPCVVALFSCNLVYLLIWCECVSLYIAYVYQQINRIVNDHQLHSCELNLIDPLTTPAAYSKAKKRTLKHKINEKKSNEKQAQTLKMNVMNPESQIHKSIVYKISPIIMFALSHP